MEQLAVLGNEQTCETHARHGARGEVFAVLSSDLCERHHRHGTGQALANVVVDHGQTACNGPGAISFPPSGLVPQ